MSHKELKFIENTGGQKFIIYFCMFRFSINVFKKKIVSFLNTADTQQRVYLSDKTN